MSNLPFRDLPAKNTAPFDLRGLSSLSLPGTQP